VHSDNRWSTAGELFGGSEEETRNALDYFRDEVKKAGFPGLHIQWNSVGGSMIGGERAKNS